MYDLLPLLLSGAPMLRCTKWLWPESKMYDLLPLLWSRSGAPMLRMCDLLPLLWSRSGAVLRCNVWKMYDLLPLLWKWCPNSKWCFALDSPMLRCTI